LTKNIFELILYILKQFKIGSLSYFAAGSNLKLDKQQLLKLKSLIWLFVNFNFLLD